MATVSFSPAVFHPDQTVFRPLKDVPPFMPILDRRHELLKQPGNLQSSTLHIGETLRLSSECNLLAMPGFSSGKSVIIDVQDSCPNSVLFSFGIGEQCTRSEKILQFLMSGSSMVEGEGLNVALLSDLMGLGTLAISMHGQPNFVVADDFSLYEVEANKSPTFLQPQGQYYLPKSFLSDRNLSHAPLFKLQDTNQVFVMTDVAKIKDLLSVVAEYHLPTSSKSSKLPMVVPYFRRTSKNHRAKCQGSSSKLQNELMSPRESSGSSGPNPIKVKSPAKKKQNRKAVGERDLYESNNYLSAFDCLLTFIVSKDGDTHSVLSLKKSGHGVTQFLYDLSTAVAGTGVAVLLSIISRVAGGRAPFCAGKLLNTGFGFGLLWLSMAVNGLRATVAYICKNSSKVNVKDQEITERVDRSVKEICFRFLALLAVLILKL